MELSLNVQRGQDIRGTSVLSKFYVSVSFLYSHSSCLDVVLVYMVPEICLWTVYHNFLHFTMSVIQVERQGLFCNPTFNNLLHVHRLCVGYTCVELLSLCTVVEAKPVCAR
jgi:hypothetical protein